MYFIMYFAAVNVLAFGILEWPIKVCGAKGFAAVAKLSIQPGLRREQNYRLFS